MLFYPLEEIFAVFRIALQRMSDVTNTQSMSITSYSRLTWFIRVLAVHNKTTRVQTQIMWL